MPHGVMTRHKSRDVHSTRTFRAEDYALQKCGQIGFLLFVIWSCTVGNNSINMHRVTNS